MKKIIFSALVAIVAVGGALAGNASTPNAIPAKPQGQAGGCDRNVNCFVNSDGPACEINGITFTGGPGTCNLRLSTIPQ